MNKWHVIIFYASGRICKQTFIPVMLSCLWSHFRTGSHRTHYSDHRQTLPEQNPQSNPSPGVNPDKPTGAKHSRTNAPKGNPLGQTPFLATNLQINTPRQAGAGEGTGLSIEDLHHFPISSFRLTVYLLDESMSVKLLSILSIEHINFSPNITEMATCSTVDADQTNPAICHAAELLFHGHSTCEWVG